MKIGFDKRVSSYYAELVLKSIVLIGNLGWKTIQFKRYLILNNGFSKFESMVSGNFERMILLAEKIFAVKNDPSQLDVNQEVLERLRKLHPDTISEYNEGNGPLAWVLLIPTTLGLMKQFLESEISEKELFNLTPLDTNYDAIYLCSALVLEEFRRKEITKRLALTAIENIRKKHTLKAAFVWAFSPEGDLAAETIARLAGLQLYKRKK